MALLDVGESFRADQQQFYIHFACRDPSYAPRDTACTPSPQLFNHVAPKHGIHGGVAPGRHRYPGIVS